MMWIFLIIIVIAIVVYAIQNHASKKKLAERRANVTRSEDVVTIIAKLENKDKSSVLSMGNKGQLYYNKYKDGKEEIPGGSQNFTIYVGADNHVTLLTMLAYGSQDFGEVDPAEAQKFLGVFKEVGGHYTTKCHYIELNEDDINDLKLESKNIPGHFYFYIEEVTPGQNRVFFSPDKNSTAYHLVDLVPINDDGSSELHRINMTLQDEQGQTFSVYTALEQSEIKDIKTNYLEKK